MLICGPKVEDHPSVGVECNVCGVKFKAGDYTALVEEYPASQEDVKRMMKGLDYNACAQEIHKECYESYKNNAQ